LEQRPAPGASRHAPQVTRFSTLPYPAIGAGALVPACPAHPGSILSETNSPPRGPLSSDGRKASRETDRREKGRDGMNGRRRETAEECYEMMSLGSHVRT
jgi:hypothetical protein